MAQWFARRFLIKALLRYFSALYLYTWHTRHRTDGIPASHGCIRMRNHDILELFELISEKALVYISEHKLDLNSLGLLG